MEKVEVEIDIDGKEAESVLAKLNKTLGILNENLKDQGKNAKESLEAVDEGAEKAKKSTFSFGKVLKGAFAIFGGAGIVALAIKAFNAFFEVLKSNSTITKFLNVAMESLSIVLNDVVNFLVSNISVVTDFFNALLVDPQKTLTDFSKKIQEGVIDRFNELLEVFGLVGKALGKLVTGDFSGAFDTIKEAGKQVVDVYTGVDKSFDKVASALTKYSKEVVKTAQENVKLAGSAELAELANVGLLENFDRMNEELRQTRDEERNTISERIQANEDLHKNLMEQKDLMLENAQISIDAAQANLNKDKNNLEFKKAMQIAENEFAAVRATIAGFESEYKAQDLALSREQLEMTTTRLESESNLNFQKQRFNADQILDDVKRLEEHKKINEAEKESETIRLQSVIDNANAGTQAKIDAQIALNEFMQTSNELQKTNETDLVNAKRTATDAQIQLDAEVRASKVQTLDTLISVAGKETSMGKALLVAKAGFALQEMIMNAQKTLSNATLVGADAAANVSGGFAKTLSAGFPQNIPLLIGYGVQAAAIIGTLRSSLRTAKQVAGKEGGGGGSNVAMPSINAPSSGGASPASFNIVGQSGTNQIADALAAQNQKPIKTYVVSSDVSSAQSLDRNIIEGATL